MFHEERRYYQVLENSIGYGENRDERDLGKNEFGYVCSILIELTPYRWESGAAIQVRVIKLIETENGTHLAYCYFQRWFYDKDFESPFKVLMWALAKGEISGRTATEAVADIFIATLKKQNYVAKFAPKYWEQWAKMIRASEVDFPVPSENPDDWSAPNPMIRPYNEIIAAAGR